MKILVAGTGALGSYFGGKLSRHHDVFFLARGKQLEALRSEGLTVHPLDAEPFSFAVNTCNSLPLSAKYDLIFIAVKTYDVKAILEQISSASHPDTVILPLQNGFVTRSLLPEYFTRKQIFGAVSWVNAAIETPGTVRQRYPGKLIYGPLVSNTPAPGNDLVDIFDSAGIQAELSGNIMREMWKKFIFICAVNGMTAYLHKTVGEILSDPEHRELFIGVMQETQAIGNSRSELVGEVVPEILTYLEHKIAPEVLQKTLGSMYFDVEKGSRLELDALNGWVVSQGINLQISTPGNQRINLALEPLKEGVR